MRANYRDIYRFMLAAALPLILLSACDRGEANGGSRDTGSPVANNPSADIISVQVMAVQASSRTRILEMTGTVRHRLETPLGFTTAGKVATVRYDVGDFVKRGALIAALDTTNVGADMNVAQAEQQRADAEYARMSALFQQGWVTKSRLETAQAAATAASARVAQAGFARSTAQLYAPSSGVVLARQMQPGQIAAPGQVAVILGQDNEGFVFRAPVPGNDAAKLRVGMAASILIEAAGNAVPVTITEIDGRANNDTGAFTVQFQMPPRAAVRSGQIGSAKIALAAADDGSLQIPASALFGVRTGEGLVYVVDPKTNRVAPRNVAVGALSDGFVAVNGGILAGDVIVITGTEKLRSGSKVKPVLAAR